MFYITISNGLLKEDDEGAHHRKKMGAAVWEYMWIIDKVTKVDDDGVGWVLGGKPINLEDMQMGTTIDTVSRNLTKLENEGYITKLRTPYGIQIKVMKAKKRFGRNVESRKKRIYKNVESKRVDKNVETGSKNVDSNKTVQYDSTPVDKVVSTPSQFSRSFFKADGKEFDEIINALRAANVPPEVIKQEVGKFISYWTEPNKSGTKERWELQRTFDVKRRLGTWFRNTAIFNKRPSTGKKVGVEV